MLQKCDVTDCKHNTKTKYPTSAIPATCVIDTKDIRTKILRLEFSKDNIMPVIVCDYYRNITDNGGK
jgi:hypothetical protein